MMKVLHSFRTNSPFTNKATCILCIGVDRGEYTVWGNYEENQHVFNVGSSLREACAWFLRRAFEDDKIFSVEEVLKFEESRRAKELEEIINKKVDSLL